MSTPGRRVMVVGGSAGSLPVIAELLAALPARTALAVVVCVHTSAPDTKDLRELLGGRCGLPVLEAEDGRRVTAGRVHVASSGYHLLVERDGAFSLCAGERENYARPCIDILFETMAEAYREALVGVLLSGANHDGAHGLQRIQSLGGLTWIQRPDAATAPEMPAAALALFAPDGQYDVQQLTAAAARIGRLAR